MKHSGSHGGLKMLTVNHFLQACHMSNCLLQTYNVQTVCILYVWNREFDML